MLLALDIGNTNTVLGLYKDCALVRDWRIRTEVNMTIDEYAITLRSLFAVHGIPLDSVRNVIISCVVPPVLNAAERFCQSYFRTTALVVGPGIRTGMPILYDNPKEVGADRIVNAVAAYELRKDAVIVVDFGTATTFDYISERGEYMGGVISPGIMIRGQRPPPFAAVEPLPAHRRDRPPPGRAAATARRPPRPRGRSRSGPPARWPAVHRRRRSRPAR